MVRALPLLALAFCAGAGLRLAVWLPETAALALAVLFGAGLIAARERPALGAAFALALVAALGVWRAGAWLQTPADSVARLSDRRWARLHGVVIAEPERRPWGVWINIEADRADTRRESLRVSGRVRVYLPADSPADFRYGSRVAAEGRVILPDEAANPGEIPPAQYLRREGIVATLSARAIRAESGRGGNLLVALALRARHALERGIAATLPGGAEGRRAGLLRGLLFSDTAALPEDTRDDFARSGTVHILSTSGVHVALLSGLVAFLFPARRPSTRRARSLLLLAALLFFALMTGLRPAVVRAVLMTGAALSAPLFDREPDVWCALGLAALALVAAAPGNLLDPGFQLSFAAAIALALWFVPPAKGAAGAAYRASRVPRWVRVSVEASVVASVATWPLAARYFGTVSLAAPLTNLVVVPLVGPAMALGLLQGILWPVAPPLAKAFGAASTLVLDAIMGITSGVARWPWSAVETFAFSAAGVVAVYASLLTLLAVRRGLFGRAMVPVRMRPALLPAGATVAALWLAWLAWSPRPLSVTFLDVGQGDATLIRTPGGRSILVDAGGRYEDSRKPARSGPPPAGTDVGWRTVVPALKRAGVRKVDVVLLTHPHEDHAGGLPPVMETFPVGLWLDGGGAHPSPGYTSALRLAAERRTPYRLARAGQRLELEPGVTLEVLAPSRPAGPEDNLNDASVVCRLVYGRTAFLLCGDAEEDAEKELLGAGALRADVVKVGHHGGATSGSAPFLEAVHPSDAVISCGRNNGYGHPSDATLQRLDAVGARVYRTDRDGAVTATSDGHRIRIRTSRWFPQ